MQNKILGEHNEISEVKINGIEIRKAYIRKDEIIVETEKGRIIINNDGWIQFIPKMFTEDGRISDKYEKQQFAYNGYSAIIIGENASFRTKGRTIKEKTGLKINL